MLRRKVALKVMRAELAAYTTTRERFLREARAAATLTHDHVVQVFACGEESGIPYLVMPLLRGESLGALLERLSVLPSLLAVRIARQAAEGLDAAHRRGLIHRDIKPRWRHTTRRRRRRSTRKCRLSCRR